MFYLLSYLTTLLYNRFPYPYYHFLRIVDIHLYCYSSNHLEMKSLQNREAIISPLCLFSVYSVLTVVQIYYTVGDTMDWFIAPSKYAQDRILCIQGIWRVQVKQCYLHHIPIADKSHFQSNGG